MRILPSPKKDTCYVTRVAVLFDRIAFSAVHDARAMVHIAPGHRYMKAVETCGLH